jgi:hypothetical protein
MVAGRYRRSWELRKEDKGKREIERGRRINRHIARQMDRETKHAINERSDTPWMYYFGEGARFWDVLRTVA